MEEAAGTGQGCAPVVVLTGPTGAGKSRLGVEVALRFDGEILNADSMQVYRFMDIGTAKPSLEERARVPHHLFDIENPDGDYNAGRFAREARAIAADVHARGRLVVLVGGTGLYIRAFLDGLLAAGGADPELREQLEREHAEGVRAGDPERLHRRLREQDAVAAKEIHPNDLRRTIRALELCSYSGRTASGLRADHAFADKAFSVLHVALDPGRDVLNERIDRRCESMIERGLLKEVRGLRSSGYGPELRSMQSIGYRHINPVVDGIDTLANAVVEMKRDTRRFVRRQRTWLRRVERVCWMDPSDEAALYRAAEGFLKRQASGAARRA
jgi:tRNA dimethylallyltransferase